MPSHSSYVALPAAYAKVALCITDMADIQPRLQPKTRSWTFACSHMYL